MTQKPFNRLTKIAAAAVLSVALFAPELAAARPVTLTAQLNNFGGSAYLAVYLTDANGKYKSTLWMAGGRAKYYKHLRNWVKATGGKASAVNGITGASVGSGGTLQVTVDLADALFDAGYQIRIDSASEGQAEAPADVVVPLTAAGAGKAVGGKIYVQSFQYSM